MVPRIRIALLSLFIMAFPAQVFAQPRIEGILDMVVNVINVAFYVSGLVAAAMVVLGGYMWMMSAGDPQKSKSAQGTITWAIIGLVFLFIFRLILEPVFGFLGHN